MNSLTKIGVYIANDGFTETVRLDWNIYWPIPRAGERLCWLGMADADALRYIATHGRHLYKEYLSFNEQEFVSLNPDWCNVPDFSRLTGLAAQVFSHLQTILVLLYGTQVKEVRYRMADNEYKIYLVMTGGEEHFTG